ncbi:MAG TPA: hypothetical protein VN258_13795 [Mobilitalea sp.]|nr:hypothetical protein [Mobilitalea sp.]
MKRKNNKYLIQINRKYICKLSKQDISLSCNDCPSGKPSGSKDNPVIIVADCFNVDKLVGSKRMTALAGYLSGRGRKPYIVTTHPKLYGTAVEDEALEQELSPVRIISRRFLHIYSSKLFQQYSEKAKKHKTLYGRYARRVKREGWNSPFSVLLRIYNRILLSLDNLRADRVYEKALSREKAALGRRYAREVIKIMAASQSRFTIITSVGGQNGYYEEGPIEMMMILLKKKANHMLKKKANHMLKKKLRFDWVYDMRDKLHSLNASGERNRIAVETEHFIYNHAKYIISVSHGERQSFIEVLGLTKEEAKKLKVVYNGFKINKCKEGAITKEPDSRILNIVYTGKTYADRFHPDMLFEAIAGLITQGLIPRNAIRFHYAGSESEAMLSVAYKYGCEHCYVNHGYVTAKESKKLQSDADLLFGIIRNEGCDIGCIPLKIMEYLGEFKPVIVIISGKEPGAEISEILAQTKAGIALEEIDYNTNLIYLKEYLLQQYQAKLTSGKVVYTGDRDAVLGYSWEQQLMKYLSFIQGGV